MIPSKQIQFPLCLCVCVFARACVCVCVYVRTSNKIDTRSMVTVCVPLS